MTLSANEQYMLELINAERLDPVSAAAEHGIPLNQGITAAHGGQIQTAPMQVLAPNAVLENLAVGHSEWMVDTHTFGHGGAGSLGIGGRIAGSQYVGPLTFRENLSAVGTSGRSETQVINAHNDNLYASAPHRAAIFDENQSEIGIGIVTGRVQSLTGSVVTQVFGAWGHTSFRHRCGLYRSR